MFLFRLAFTDFMKKKLEDEGFHVYTEDVEVRLLCPSFINYLNDSDWVGRWREVSCGKSLRYRKVILGRDMDWWCRSAMS